MLQERSNIIKQKALELGFEACGISKADFLEEEAPLLEKWLNLNYHGKMAYMANHFDKRLDPRKLVDGAKSVITVILNYFPEEPLSTDEDSYKISKYAYGTDYHFVLKDKLKDLMNFISEEIGEVNGRIFVDSAPVMDKVWAKKSGIGWIGKHSNLITREIGSFFFIGEIICDLELQTDSSMKDYCGTCTRCVDACPTDAIVQPYVVDGSKCISYFTIELKEAIPDEVKGQFENWIFGCDICQDVCPWNRFSKPSEVTDFRQHPDLKNFTKSDWEEITQEVFQEIFRRSALKRTKLEGLKRNISFVKLAD
ncbi:iron-sulfur cluster binding protein [Emticicia oligotrophica DSM 17448]|uniref:Epoxyqueuosine reductase n=1 Tax=Emticicia oligotrophica (strain DSM 17448 / CIP 109782 / MTCC 6937 / GPTSA100-15) TaxID=929562 RepID=A0ABN4ANT6_EMTOG|nr:tRNA epoxyqueuosine(34) reductase QueG [Emticicia oligotrophica]AFK04105.1 iron-sulfur cluster binding protein [Emticicia oligotrophica DSM 17448]